MPDEIEPATSVVFRRWPKKQGATVLALFPGLPGTYDPATCSSYAHVGQHGAADYSACMERTVPADSEAPDVLALRAELERIGYRLRIIRRAGRLEREARKAALQ
jgi:hypothetical protein